MHARCSKFPAINALSLLLTLVPSALSPSSMSIPGPHLSLPPTIVTGRQSALLPMPITALRRPILIPNGLVTPSNARS